MTVELDDGGPVRADELLVAIGRRPNTDDIGLDSVGPRAGQADRGGRPRCAPNDWLYAIGDVNGRALLTHMGKYQARIAADVILGYPSGCLPTNADGSRSPRVIFTDPHVAAVGYTLEAAQADGLNVRARRRVDPGQRGSELLRPRRRPRDLAARGRRRSRPDRRRHLHRPGGGGVASGGDDRRRGRGAARPAGPRGAARSPRAARCGSTCSRRSAWRGRAAGRRGRRICRMDVVVAGGHGKIGIRLLRLLADGGHRARGLIRNPDHAGDLEAVGAEPVVCDIEALDDLSELLQGRRRRGVRRRRGTGQRGGAQADGGLRRRREADRGGEEERDRPLRDGQRDQRGPPRRVVGADAPVLRGEGGRRQGAARERPELHHRAPGRAHRRSGNGARQDRHGPRARRGSARGRGRHAAGRAGDARARSARPSSSCRATRRSTRPSGRCERAARRRGPASRALGPRGPRHHLRRPDAGRAALRGRGALR